MKQDEHHDYGSESYDVVPEWVEDFMTDRLEGGFVISSLRGGWIMAGHDDVTDLEDER